jgi:hypothetical protein
MSKVFLSYSAEDHFFAELAGEKLAAAGIEMWRDKGQLVPGTEWRKGIETGISTSLAVLVALSPHSAESSYVTYEWAYALGKGRRVIPLKLLECSVHKRLEILQDLDFSVPVGKPWERLIALIREEEMKARSALLPPSPEQVNAALGYVNQLRH